MSDCTWSVLIFEHSDVPEKFKNKNIVLVKWAPQNNYQYKDLFNLVKGLGYDTSCPTWQNDRTKYIYPPTTPTNTLSGCGSSWTYLANAHPSRFSNLPKVFDLDQIIKSGLVLVIDKMGNEITNVSQDHQSSGARCVKCNEYNPYVESRSDFICYRCKNNY